MIHDFFTDRDDVWCWRKGAESTEGAFEVVPAEENSTGYSVEPVDPAVSYCRIGASMAIFLNAISIFFILFLAYLFYGSILAKQDGQPPCHPRALCHIVGRVDRNPGAQAHSSPLSLSTQAHRRISSAKPPVSAGHPAMVTSTA